MHLNELIQPHASKASFTFGRFNPPTKGHSHLLDIVKKSAGNGDHFVFTGRTNDPKRNPLQYQDKITLMRAMFPTINIVDDPKIMNPWQALEELGKHYDDVTLVVGADRKQDFQAQMKPYMKDFGLKNFTVISSGERDADASDVQGISATKARAFARAGDYKSFAQTVDGGEKLKQTVYNKVRQGMGITEETKPRIPKLPKKNPNPVAKQLADPKFKPKTVKDKKKEIDKGYVKHRGTEFKEAEQGKPIVYVDLDGVLANFFEEYAKLAKVKTGNYRDIPPAKVDPTLQKMVGTDFFDRLPKFPTTDKLLQMITEMFGGYTILSAPLRGDHKNSEAHKRKWIQRELAIQPENIIVVGRKDSYATQKDGTPNVLIDDRGKNVQAWSNRGGLGIKYQADEDPISKVQDALTQIKNKDNLKEWGGLVVKGVNTTVDVGMDAIKKQSAKLGFKVTKKGVPPIMNTKGQPKSKKLESINRMKNILIDINGSNRDLTLQQQIDLLEVTKGIRKFTEAKRVKRIRKANQTEVPYQNDQGTMSLFTHPGTELWQRMRATAKPGTEDWFKTWRTLSYLTKGRKNHYMLPIKEQLEKLLIKHGILEQVPHPAPTPPQPPQPPVPTPPVVNKVKQVIGNVDKIDTSKIPEPALQKANMFVKNILVKVQQKLSQLTGEEVQTEDTAGEMTLDNSLEMLKTTILNFCQEAGPKCASMLQGLGIENVEQVPEFLMKAQAGIHSQGKEQGKAEAKKEAQESLNKLNAQIDQLARKVANYQDPDPGTKYNSKEKKVQANAEVSKKLLQQGLFSLFFEYVYFKQELTEEEVINFVKDCVAGNVLNMQRMFNDKNGIIDTYVQKHKKVYDTVVKKLINYKGSAVTGGAIGPAEILLSAIGSPVSKDTKGDLAVVMPDGTTVGVEVKAGSKAKGSGARLNGTAINDGKGALRLMRKLYADLGITVNDLEKKSYTISEKYLATLNKKLATFNNAKLNQYVVGVLQALVNNYDEIYEKESGKIEAMITATIQPGDENGPIIFKKFRDLITYVQLISYNLTDGVTNIMTVDTGKRTFSITGSPEEFVSQIGTRHVQAASLSITSDPQTASFHWRSV